MIKAYLFFFFVLSIVCLPLEKDKIITGRIFNKSDGEAIPGASIRIPGTNKGTYSSSKGFFRIPLSSSNKEIKISSLGYESQTIKIQKGDDSLFIYLKESSVMKRNITVTGNIEPNEVIRRAIERKNDNISKLKTFHGILYSKLNISLDGSLLASASSNSISIGATTQKNESEKYRMTLLETVSETNVNYTKKLSSSKILQRRQTSNLKPNDNFMVIGNFISFYDNEIKMMSTSIITPLSDDALKYYKYEILDKQTYDDKFVYVIKVIPDSRIFPTFTGTIKIIEDDYNIVEADLKPSEYTSITFVDSLHFHQKYTESIEKIWYPSYLEVNGKGKVEVIKGLLDIRADITATSIYSDIQINIPLPDSLFNEVNRRQVSVDSLADSTKPEFWKNNSLREITPEEDSIYNKVDSLVARDTVKAVPNRTSSQFNFLPYVDFNRVSSIMAGLTFKSYLLGFNISATGSWSFGLKNIFWLANISRFVSFGKEFGFTLGASAYSQIGTISLDNSYPRIINSIFAGLFHFDYYDYMKENGWAVYATGEHDLFSYQLGFQSSKLGTLKKTTNRSAFSSRKWRENPTIDDGNFAIIHFGGKIGNVNYFLPTEKFENEMEFSSVLGRQSETGSNFYSALGKYKTSIPLFETGYSPVKINLIFEGGISSHDVPLQFQHRMQSSMLFYNLPGNFLSAKPALYGGREYYAGSAMLNLTDVWWRFLGLPLYEGRGINLTLAGSYGKFFAKGKTFYQETGKLHYSEIGFGLTRIPTFISNVIYLSFDARWGIGPMAKGNFGWSMFVSLPL